MIKILKDFDNCLAKHKTLKFAIVSSFCFVEHDVIFVLEIQHFNKATYLPLQVTFKYFENQTSQILFRSLFAYYSEKSVLFLEIFTRNRRMFEGNILRTSNCNLSIIVFQ